MPDALYPNRLPERNIRILKLIAGDEEAPLECHLVEYSLNNLPSYEALSYVWGDPKVTEPISCNDQAMEITTSLAQALRRLRMPGSRSDTRIKADKNRLGEGSVDPEVDPELSGHTSRMIWADAICINQQDVSERSAQVQLMRDIYSSAATVVVWLGPDENSVASNAVAVIRRINDYLSAYSQVVEQVRQSESTPSWLRGRSHFTFQLCEAALRSDGLESPWSLLRELFLLPWWSRTWCVQEVFLAQEVSLLFGQETIDGKIFTAFTEWYMRESTFETARGLSSSQPENLNHPVLRTAHASFSHTSRNREELLLVCEDFRTLKATDPRDKVYGLLGLWQPSLPNDHNLEVNYSKTVAEVYTDLALQAIQNRKDLFILRFVNHDTGYQFGKDDSFPSWVPRWDDGKSSQFAWLDKSPLRASKFAAAVLDEESARSGILKVEGVLFDRIIWTSNVLESGAVSLYTDAEFGHSFIRLYKEANGEEPETKFPHRVSLTELATTLTSGFIKIGNEILDRDIDDPNAWLDIAELDTDTGLEYLNNFQTFMDTEKYPGDPNKLKLVLCHGQRLFRTSKGYLGLGRRNTQMGDFVAVLHGGRVPHVLRIQPIPPKAFFSYVGDCFVYEIMNGQVYDMFDEDGVMPGTFELH